jgi:hypothetical protein
MAKTLPNIPGVQIDDSDAARALFFVKRASDGAVVVTAELLDLSSGRVAASPTMLVTATPTFVALTGAQKLQFDNVLKGIFQDLVTAAGAV